MVGYSTLFVLAVYGWQVRNTIRQYVTLVLIKRFAFVIQKSGSCDEALTKGTSRHEISEFKCDVTIDKFLLLLLVDSLSNRLCPVDDDREWPSLTTAHHYRCQCRNLEMAEIDNKLKVSYVTLQSWTYQRCRLIFAVNQITTSPNYARKKLLMKFYY